MFNPTRLLGSLVAGGLRNEIGPVTGAALGMGALGVAIAAFEHFTEQENRPAATASAPPPPPPAAAAHAAPGTTPLLSPPPAAAGPAEAALDPRHRRSTLLLRGMIAAALADGELDEAERRRIQERLRDAALSDAERAFAAREFFSPATIEQLAADVDSPECAEELYAASRLAVKLDNDAERRHLAALAVRLGLAPEATQRIDAALDAGADR
ncbi:tellurite resistance TerB family protein [bacterium]|nr:tellurite resistance TerB family protein [bacterium]